MEDETFKAVPVRVYGETRYRNGEWIRPFHTQYRVARFYVDGRGKKRRSYADMRVFLRRHWAEKHARMLTRKHNREDGR